VTFVQAQAHECPELEVADLGVALQPLVERGGQLDHHADEREPGRELLVGEYGCLLCGLHATDCSSTIEVTKLHA
jgi:hypothetical protein